MSRPFSWSMEKGLLKVRRQLTVELGSREAAALLAPGEAADRAWHLLEDQDDMGWVTAGKLLARKRPRLVPVYDRVVRCAFGTRGLSFWLWLNDRFSDYGGALPTGAVGQHPAQCRSAGRGVTGARARRDRLDAAPQQPP